MINHRTKTETPFEIACAFIFGRNWRDRSNWCGDCGTYNPLVTSLTAATFEQTTVLEIFRRAETGKLHYKVTTQGALLICFGSLLKTEQTLVSPQPIF